MQSGYVKIRRKKNNNKKNLGLQGYTLFFLFLLKNIDCGYSSEPLRQSMYLAERNEKKKKNIRVFLSENFEFWEVKFSIYLNRCVFVMCQLSLLTSFTGELLIYS